MINKDVKTIIVFLLLIISFWQNLTFIFSNREYFTRHFDPQFFSRLYSESQYVKGQASEGGIGDDGLYAFAGYYYLFQKGDVSSVNFEHPPLGKYLIGLSILLFNNENIINLIYYALLLFFTYKLAKIILRSVSLSFLAVCLISIDPLIHDHLLRSLLDLPFTLFFVVAVYYYLLSFKNTNYTFISQLLLGMAFSTRFFPSLILIYTFFSLIKFLYQRKAFLQYFYTSFLIPIIYMLSHISFFYYHPSIIEFIRHKIWMLSWFKGSVIIMGNIWRNLFTGYYIDSTGKIQINQYWTIILPITLVLAITRVRKNLIKKDNYQILVIYFTSVIYLIYLTFLTGGLEKFFMPIYPLIIILALSNISCIIETCRKWNLRRLKAR